MILDVADGIGTAAARFAALAIDTGLIVAAVVVTRAYAFIVQLNCGGK